MRTRIFRQYIALPMLDQHFFQFLGGDAERLIFALNEADTARRKRFSKINDARIVGWANKILWDDANAEARFDHRENLIGGKGLDIRTERQAVSRKEAGIKRIGLRIRAECDERMGPQFLQRDGTVQQVPEGRRTDGNLLDLPDVCLLKGRRVQNRRRDNGKICSRLSQSGDSLRGRMIADAQAHARILGAECLEHR